MEYQPKDKEYRLDIEVKAFIKKQTQRNQTKVDGTERERQAREIKNIKERAPDEDSEKNRVGNFTLTEG